MTLQHDLPTKARLRRYEQGAGQKLHRETGAGTRKDYAKCGKNATPETDYHDLVAQNVVSGGGLAVQFMARHCGDRRVAESRPTLT